MEESFDLYQYIADKLKISRSAAKSLTYWIVYSKSPNAIGCNDDLKEFADNVIKQIISKKLHKLSNDAQKLCLGFLELYENTKDEKYIEAQKEIIRIFSELRK